MPGRNLYNSTYDLDGRHGKERDQESGEMKENPWHKYCKKYAQENKVSYAAAISLAGPSWREHKEKHGLSFRDRSGEKAKREAKKQQQEGEEDEDMEPRVREKGKTPTKKRRPQPQPIPQPREYRGKDAGKRGVHWKGEGVSDYDDHTSEYRKRGGEHYSGRRDMEEDEYDETNERRYPPTKRRKQLPPSRKPTPSRREEGRYHDFESDRRGGGGQDYYWSEDEQGRPYKVWN
jgi:hypothetical protein